MSHLTFTICIMFGLSTSPGPPYMIILYGANLFNSVKSTTLNKMIAYLIQKIKQNPDNTYWFSHSHKRQFQSQSVYSPINLGSDNYNVGKFSTISTVSKLTVITLPINLTMYWGSSARFGSLTMPLRLSVLTRYWSTIHSNAERVPRR